MPKEPNKITLDPDDLGKPSSVKTVQELHVVMTGIGAVGYLNVAVFSIITKGPLTSIKYVATSGDERFEGRTDDYGLIAWHHVPAGYYTLEIGERSIVVPTQTTPDYFVQVYVAIEPELPSHEEEPDPDLEPLSDEEIQDELTAETDDVPPPPSSEPEI